MCWGWVRKEGWRRKRRKRKKREAVETNTGNEDPRGSKHGNKR